MDPVLNTAELQGSLPKDQLSISTITTGDVRFTLFSFLWTNRYST